MPLTDLTRIIIDITFGTGPVVITGTGGTPATRQPEVDLVREILMKALKAFEDEEQTIAVNVDNGTIVRDTSFHVPPLPSIFDAPSAPNLTPTTAALPAHAAPAPTAEAKPKTGATAKPKTSARAKPNDKKSSKRPNG